MEEELAEHEKHGQEEEQEEKQEEEPEEEPEEELEEEQGGSLIDHSSGLYVQPPQIPRRAMPAAKPPPHPATAAATTAHRPVRLPRARPTKHNDRQTELCGQR